MYINTCWSALLVVELYHFPKTNLYVRLIAHIKFEIEVATDFAYCTECLLRISYQSHTQKTMESHESIFVRGTDEGEGRHAF